MLLTDNSLPQTPSFFILKRWTSAIQLKEKVPQPVHGIAVASQVKIISVHSLLIMRTSSLLKTKSKLISRTITFCGLYVHIFSIQERSFSFKCTSSSNSPSLLKLPTKTGDSQCQIPERMSKRSHEGALQFGWPTI